MINNQVHSLTLEQKIGQLFFIGIAGAEVDGETRSLLDEISPGGICLFSRNIREAMQTRGLLDEIRSSLPATPFLSVDQEGGMVDRLKRLLTPMPAANRITSGAEASELGAIIAEALHMLGFNMDFAPVVDVVNETRAKYSNGLFSRPFGKTEKDAAEFAGEFLLALQAGGIMGCLKHFPGLGAAAVDSHEELPIVDVMQAAFSSTDLFPYRLMIASGNVHAVMAAHAAYPLINLQETDRNGKLLPSSLSYNFVTNLLRGELGFDGLVITDDLEMGAIVKNYGIGEACKMAVAAGVDMLAICANPDAIRVGYNAVLNAARSGEIGMGRIDGSLHRIALIKSKLSAPLEFDTGRLDRLSDKIASLNQRLTA